MTRFILIATLSLAAGSALAAKSDSYLLDQAYPEDLQIWHYRGEPLGIAHILFTTIFEEEGYTCLPQDIVLLERGAKAVEKKAVPKGQMIVCDALDRRNPKFNLYTTRDDLGFSVFGIQVGTSAINDEKAVAWFDRLISRVRKHILNSMGMDSCVTCPTRQ